MVMAELQSPFEEGLYPYWAKRDGVPGIIVPQAANAISPGAGVGYAWPAAWTQITAGLAFPLVLCGGFIDPIIVAIAGTGNTVHDTQWQVGTGAPPEVVIASSQVVRTFSNPAPNTINVSITHTYTWRCDPQIVPASTRLAFRHTQNTAVGLVGATIYLFGYDARKFPPIAGNIDLRRWLAGHRLSSGVMVVPSAAAGTAVLCGAGFALGAWVQMMVAARDMLVTGVSSEGGVVISKHVQGQIGIGPPGGAVVAEDAFAFPGRAITLANVGTIELYRPLFVKAGEAISIRAGVSTAGITLDFWLRYRELY